MGGVSAAAHTTQLSTERHHTTDHTYRSYRAQGNAFSKERERELSRPGTASIGRDIVTMSCPLLFSYVTVFRNLVMSLSGRDLRQ